MRCLFCGRETNSEINHDMYLTLTDQVDYINPHNGKTEVDSSDYRYRWVDAGGNIIYSNSETCNPNFDPKLNVSGYKGVAKNDVRVR